jgi:hypothetical protein
MSISHFSRFTVVFAIFNHLQFVFLIFHDFQYSRHIPGPRVCISHFSRFTEVFDTFFIQ